MDRSHSLRTPLKRARGLGSGHAGTHHFWVQRISAGALAPLSLWFIAELCVKLIGGDRSTLAAWLNHPLHALAMIGLLIALFTHARMGVQVIIEDYVKSEDRKIMLLLLLSSTTYILGGAAVMAVIKLHFFGM